MKKTYVVVAGLVALPIVAVAGGPKWSWREAVVDQRADYLEARYGSADDDPESWVPVARVGRGQSRVFRVQWLVDPRAVENRERVAAVVSDIEYCLNVVGGPDPWAYAQYHCGTAANWYSRLHWLCAEAQPDALRAARK
jgi:hypothetical protein